MVRIGATSKELRHNENEDEDEDEDEDEADRLKRARRRDETDQTDQTDPKVTPNCTGQTCHGRREWVWTG